MSGIPDSFRPEDYHPINQIGYTPEAGGYGWCGLVGRPDDVFREAPSGVGRMRPFVLQYDNGRDPAETRDFCWQVAGQQDAVNRLTVDQYLSARELFSRKGRGPKNAQQEARRKFRANLDRRLRFEFSDLEATTRRVMSDRVMGQLSALHEPDQVLGGRAAIFDQPLILGGKTVNNAIGAAQPDIVRQLDVAARAAQDEQRKAYGAKGQIEDLPPLYMNCAVILRVDFGNSPAELSAQQKHRASIARMPRVDPTDADPALCAAIGMDPSAQTPANVVAAMCARPQDFSGTNRPPPIGPTGLQRLHTLRSQQGVAADSTTLYPLHMTHGVIAAPEPQVRGGGRARSGADQSLSQGPVRPRTGTRGSAPPGNGALRSSRRR